MSFSFPPKGWALCNGQLLAIAQNQALFALLGTMYGGNGQTTFALPDLRGRVPIHFNGSFPQGSLQGEEAHTLTSAEMPVHIHTVTASSNIADQGNPAPNYWAVTSSNTYASAADSLMAAQCVSTAGGSQPHENRPPFLTISFCIALQGIFPSRS